MRIVLTVLFSAIYLINTGCTGEKKAQKKEVLKNQIIQDLEKIKGKGMLFGHQDDLAYGIGWKYEQGESDVKRVAGDYPALMGWELGGIELGHTENLDTVPFDKMRELAIWAHNKGAVNTFSWHPFSPIDSINSWHGDSVVVRHILPGGSYHRHFIKQLDCVADFFLSLNDSLGNAVPFIFRPWHEMDGTWFWWGQKACSPDEFKALFRLTISHLREKGISNMVIAYSPDRNFNSAEEYLKWYPGDDMVDILGMDNYYDLSQPSGELEAIRKLHLVINLARQKNKLAALTETGQERVPDSLWFTGKLGKVLNDELVKKELSYAMVWRNASLKHFYFPYPGHPAATDAKSLTDQPHVLLLNEFNQYKK